MRKLIGALLAGAMLFGGIACDDQADNEQQIDEDDSNLGPGDGNDETGPGR